LAKKIPDASITAIDISPAALEVAQCNAKRHGVSVEFLSGSLFQPVAGRLFDLIVSNPPYIRSSDIDGLEPEVRDYDPRGALDGGIDGFYIYRSMIPDAAEFLTPGGWLLIEVGAGQAQTVAELFRSAGGFEEPFVVNDNGSIERVVAARRKE
jgi:release factor glutamine methyltransferase